MGSKSFKSHKPKPFNFHFILFLIGLLFFSIIYLRQLRDEYQMSIAYESIGEPEWLDVVARELGDEYDTMKMALVNMDGVVEKFRSRANIVNVQFDRVHDNVKWSDLFPGWIDENSPPNCPKIPMPNFQDYEDLDVVVTSFNCSEFDQGSHSLRDVFRLQVNLVVANLLARSGRWKVNGVHRPVYAVFIGSCSPMLEIFTCDDLLWSDGYSWVYQPSLSRIKQKVLMPVGSCQLAPPFSQSGEELWRNQVSELNPKYKDVLPRPREAYVTVLHSSEAYVCGAIALAQSITLSNTTKDLILLADQHISPRSLQALRASGWKIERIQRIRSPHAEKNAYNEWNYSKLRIWQLEEYDKVMFIDSDFIVTRNLDEFFIYPQISASPNDIHIFNSGLMLVEPSECTFNTLMKKKMVVESYNGGDQGFLNEMFTWWHRLPAKINYMKYFDDVSDVKHQISKDVYAVHYLGLKPWTCYRDYDCNWDKLESRQFASDSANEIWWQIYDVMPKKLKQFCSLTPEMDARILKYRAKAEAGRFSDEHWKIEAKDPRRLSSKS